MTAVDVDPRPLAGRRNALFEAGERGRRWMSDLTRRTGRPRPTRLLRSGITVNGVSEPNVTVLVTLADQALAVSADCDGRWTASFALIDVPSGAVEIPVCAMTTDASGQTTKAEGTVQV